MGAILNEASGQRIFLNARSLVGRARACDAQLQDRFVSGEHATISWNGQQWRIRDLGSTNGTFVGKERLPAGDSAPLSRGAALGFGAAEGWTFVDDGPPVPTLYASDDSDPVRVEEFRIVAREPTCAGEP